jgi:hypothetical protein
MVINHFPDHLSGRTLLDCQGHSSVRIFILLHYHYFLPKTCMPFLYIKGVILDILVTISFCVPWSHLLYNIARFM